MIRLTDLIRFSWITVRTHRLRSLLTISGIVLGIASVMLLTGLGDGVKDNIHRQFTQFGTGLVIMTPGKTEVFGIPGNLGGTYKDITFADLHHLERLPGIKALAPVVAGTAKFEYGRRQRDIQVYGVTSQGIEVWDVAIRQGSYIETTRDGEGPAAVILGSKVKQEIFGNENSLGKRVRVGGSSFLVAGVLEPKGELMGVDLNDSVTIPAARAMRLFNTEAILEVDIKLTNPSQADQVIKKIEAVMLERHGQEDVTIISQEDFIKSLDSIMDIMKFSVTAIASISLLVGAIGILTIMWICVHERRSEIGLFKSLGATRGVILKQFLIESGMLSLAGGVAGLLLGFLISLFIAFFLPELPMKIDYVVVALALIVSLAVGLISGLGPALRASNLEAADTLRAL